ncbi:MAG: aldehyde dehydrogenase family protein [Nanoarchaeota archaeon]|nr:aldehyde dehydrogenase family protein [Nanoarchaeota archaeon]
MEKLISTNPGKNYEVIGEVDVTTGEEIKKIFIDAKNAKLSWKETSISKRISLLRPICESFKKIRSELALTTCKEIGKPITSALEGIDSGVSYFEDFMNDASEYLEDEISYDVKGLKHRIVFEPLGVVAVIVPWNFPFESFVSSVIPNLIVGNTVIFKISEECPLVGKLMGEIMDEHNLPKGVFRQIYGNGSVGAKLLEEEVDFISFTGSTKLGQEIYKISSEKFIRNSLELGGSNPGIVFEDVELNDELISRIAFRRFDNCGQYCDGVKRLIVHESIFDELVEKLKNYIEENIIVGDPEDINTNIGSLVAKRQQILLESQIEDALNKGATLITGGIVPKKPSGAYFLPTILTNINKGMRVWHEEVFGPALPIVKFKTEEEAINLANDTIYGLGGEVYSEDIIRCKRVASKIEAGTIGINFADVWSSSTPFGGYKKSGIGRGLGKYGFRELCQIKVVAEYIDE